MAPRRLALFHLALPLRFSSHISVAHGSTQSTTPTQLMVNRDKTAAQQQKSMHTTEPPTMSRVHRPKSMSLISENVVFYTCLISAHHLAPLSQNHPWALIRNKKPKPEPMRRKCHATLETYPIQKEKNNKTKTRAVEWFSKQRSIKCQKRKKRDETSGPQQHERCAALPFPNSPPKRLTLPLPRSLAAKPQRHTQLHIFNNLQ